MTGRRHRGVVVGGGFGGVNAARGLARADVDVTIVDRTNHHLFQPLLYQVATGILPGGLIASALRRVIRKQPNAHAVLAEVQQLDLDGRVVHALAPDGRELTLPYDSLVVAAGCTDAYFGHDAFASALANLDLFRRRWPAVVRTLIAGRYPPEQAPGLILGLPAGIKSVVAFDPPA